MQFSLLHKDGGSKARAGEINSDHGKVETPAFIPVGSIGTVKTVSPQEMRECRVQMILGNTYHLYLRPGLKILQEFRGLHRFNGWNGPILTDSGGFQIYSLDDLRRVNKNGVEFRSHWDGSKHLFTPENVVDIQRAIGSDIMMVLDYLTGNPSDFETAATAHQRTLEWAERAREQFQKTKPFYDYEQYQFGIIQGGVYPELREESLKGLLETGFEGYAIGGLAVGEDAETRYKITDFCTGLLPELYPRYLMGVGKPKDILDGIELGVDMFDCVIPTRNARNGAVFTRKGRLNIRNTKHKIEQGPIEEGCECFACRNHSRGYIYHMFKVNEMYGLRLATIHNLYFYQSLMIESRKAILKDEFSSFKRTFLSKNHEAENNE